MPAAPTPRMHGLTHVPGGPDPIPGLMVDPGGGNWEDRIRAAGILTAWWRLGDTFIPASSVTNAAVDSAAFDGSSPRNLNYVQTSHAATPNVPGAPALDTADDGALEFADTSDAYLVQQTGAFAGYSPPWDVTVWGTSGDQLRSLTCWIKTPGEFTYKRPILGRWNMDVSGSSNVGWVLDLNGSSLRFQAVLTTGAVVINGPSLTADTWYHVALTYNPADTTYRLYVNGTLDSGATDSHALAGEPSGATFRIGMGGYDFGLTEETLYFKGGTIDEVALYKTTLTGDVIADLAAGVTVADGFVWTTTGGTPSWQPPTVEVDGTRYEELLLGTNLTGTPSGDVLTIDASGGGSGIPATIVDAKGDLIAASAADTVARLPVGSNDQVLVADSAQTLGLKWAAVPGTSAFIPVSTIDAKGDLLAGSANDTIARLPVGSNGQVLTADSAQTLGVKWAAASAGAGVAADTIWDAKGDLAAASAADTAARLAVGSDGQVLTADSTQTLGVKWATVGGTGTLWRNGSGAPSSGLGSLGDYYYNDSNRDVYRKDSVASAAAYAAAGTWAAADATTINIPMPASITSGELLILLLTAVDDAVTTKPTITTPTGWTRFINHVAFDFGGAGAMCGYWKIATGSETTLTVTADRSSTMHGNCFRVTGADTTTPINVTATSASITATTSPAAPAATTTVANCLIVGWLTVVANTSYTAASGFTERQDHGFANGSPGRTNTQTYADKIQAASGAGGPYTFTVASAGSQPQGSATFAIAPGGATPTWVRLGAFAA